MSHNHPSTFIKNYKLIFVDSENREPIYITERKAEIIRKFLSDRSSSYIDLTDDDGNYCETIQKRAIKSIVKIEPTKPSNRAWICRHGNRQPMSQGVYLNPITGKKEWTAVCFCDQQSTAYQVFNQ